MRRLVLTSMLIVAAAAAGCAGAQPEPVTTPRAPESEAPVEVVEAVKDAVEQYRQAYEVRALEALEPLYVRGPELVVITGGRRYRGWEEVRGYLSELLQNAREVRMKLSDLKVIKLGDASALATVAVEREIGDGTTSVTENGLLSLVFLYRSGLQGAERWRIVGEHFSRTPRTP